MTIKNLMTTRSYQLLTRTSDVQLATMTQSCHRERRRVMDYYAAKLPRPAHDGNSKFVSQDVYDAVESMKAALLETFSTGNKTLRFAPQNADDVDTAEVCTEYTDYVLHRQNNLFETMQTVIHDGLIARAGIAKVYWCMQDESTLEYVENLLKKSWTWCLPRTTSRSRKSSKMRWVYTVGISE